MNLFEIVKFPKVIENNHESIFRSYHILEKVKYYLQEGVPAKVILEVIDELEKFGPNDELTRRPTTLPEGREVLCGRVERLVGQ